LRSAVLRLCSVSCCRATLSCALNSGRIAGGSGFGEGLLWTGGAEGTRGLAGTLFTVEKGEGSAGISNCTSATGSTVSSVVEARGGNDAGRTSTAVAHGIVGLLRSAQPLDKNAIKLSKARNASRERRSRTIREWAELSIKVRNGRRARNVRPRGAARYGTSFPGRPPR
jgi:hypothetical protein